jgi:hypothetical protein
MVTREVRRGMKASTVVAGPGNWLISALGATLEESRPIPGKVHIVVSVSNRSLHRSARAFVIYSCDYNHLRYKALTKRKTLKKTIITGVIAQATDREDDIQSFVASFLHKSRNEVYDTPLLST